MERAHKTNIFRMRDTRLSESKEVAGEQKVTIVTLWNGLPVSAAQRGPVAERMFVL